MTKSMCPHAENYVSLCIKQCVDDEDEGGAEDVEEDDNEQSKPKLGRYM